MKKNLRLKKPSDFKKVLKEGKRFISPHFVLYVLKNKKSCSRFGISISKRHCKLATDRNKLRRRAKEFFRLHINLRLEEYDVVVISRLVILKTEMNKIFSEIRNLWDKWSKS